MTALLKAATSLPPPSNLRCRSNEPDAWQTKYRGGFSEERDAEYHGSDCTDAGPHRICGPKWKERSDRPSSTMLSTNEMAVAIVGQN